MLLLKQLNAGTLSTEGINGPLLNINRVIIKVTAETIWKEIFVNFYDRTLFEVLEANKIIFRSIDEGNGIVSWAFTFLKTTEHPGVFFDDQYSRFEKELYMFDLEMIHGGVLFCFVLTMEECQRMDRDAIKRHVDEYITAIVSRM